MENLILAIEMFIVSEDYNKHNQAIQYLIYSLYHLLTMPSSDMLRSKNSQEPTK